MVAILHARGFEGLRIAPHLAPSGTDWRCYLVPKGRMRSFFQFAPSFFELDPKATYSTGNHWEPFGWKGVAASSAEQWADRFVCEFKQTCSESQLSSPDYVRWFKVMLRETTALIYAWDDYNQCDPLRLFDSAGSYPMPAEAGEP